MQSRGSDNCVMTSNGPTVFPTLLPNQLHHAWFPEKYQLAKESAITKAEEAYEAWKHALRNQGDGIPLYGKISDEHLVDPREEASVTDNTSEDDLDTDVLDDQDSLHDNDIDMTPADNNTSPIL
ncbi:hypothetical protein EB796_012020 [Bugula neritina]|uniref:Uncharacterized protein n=1 Tax=Bugula neritina TaxID=10212 RepID=A0A7J7JTJ1_BUGNE|nr:hypothetical protein EB796_012020 [Bugula neritina]